MDIPEATLFIYVFLKDAIYLFLERGEVGEKQRERNINMREKHGLFASCMCPDWDLTHNPGMCPDQESTSDFFSMEHCPTN